MNSLVQQTSIFLQACQWWQALSGLGWIVSSFFIISLSYCESPYALFGKIVIAFFLLRGTGMALNQVCDKEFDRWNPRTAERAIPRGVLTPTFCLLGALVQGLLFLYFCFSSFDRKVAFLGVFSLGLVSLYSFLKRWTFFCHGAVGLCHALIPIVVSYAFEGRLSTPLLYLSAVCFFSVSGTDILYALQDCDYDRKMGLHSFPAMFGVRFSFGSAFFMHMIALSFMGAMLYALHILLVIWVLFFAFSGVLLKKWSSFQKMGPYEASRVSLRACMCFFPLLAVFLLFMGYVWVNISSV